MSPFTRLRRHPWRSATAAAVLAGAVLWTLPGRAQTEGAAPTAQPVHARSAALAAARRTMDPARLDAFLVEQRARAAASDDPAEWRVLAQACLERVLLASSRFGMAVARPTFPRPPQLVLDLLAEGEAAVARARELGDRDSDLPRIEAGLLGNRIDGALAAIRFGSKVDALIDEALRLDPGNAHAAVARGCRLVFAPKWLGGDPQRARELFLAAAEALPDDERPLVFAAFAAHVLGDASGAREALARAVARNPANEYAREVARRLAAGEAEPFERDLPPR